MLNLLLNKNTYYILAFVAICSICFFAGAGHNQAKADKTIAQLKLDHEKVLQEIKDANQKALTERQDQINSLQLEFSIADQKYYEVMKNVQSEIARRDADILNLRSVQRVKIKPVVCRAEGKDSDKQGANDATYAELDPETTVRAFGVTDEGDRAIIQLNELQKKVVALAKVCPIMFID